jgi:hypothetical protein
MTDKELLELAAKAHGYLVYDAGCEGWFYKEPDGTRGAWWNPLEDDGDAFRLAVKLGIAVTPYPVFQCSKHSVIVKQHRNTDLQREHNPTEVAELYGDDPCAATRRAIVRAAAAIGKKL